ncbi:hypothetical protein [Aliikangiella sp. G2MR2-5]|uniref:hypothetical protein n=1 Tax=Aliikangiella sp. G2MR2-5 TaxID=2788943 RepID=UPI0018A973FF|nr:hypothetical protein [Aliikangiella sp. G2MR2-5]
MKTAIIVIILVFAFLIGGMITLLNTANKYKFPDTYDKSKVGFDDEESWPDSASGEQPKNNSNEKKEGKSC